MTVNQNQQEVSVSIAMATYNGAAWLPAQIDSILKQSFHSFELVIVDDASTDNTRQLLNEYQQQDSRIKLFFNEKNKGYRQTFYDALSRCSGEFILFSDQDDVWKPDKIGTLLHVIGNDLLVFSDSELINEKGDSLDRKLSDTVRMLQPGSREINRGFVIGNCVWGHTILFHRSLLKEALRVGNDHPHDWWFAVVSSHLQKIRYCPDVLNQYRQHAGNLTQAIPSRESQRKKISGRKLEEYATQLARLASIKNLPFNNDKAFYEKWHSLYIKRQKGFTLSLFWFLLANRKEIFCMKRKNFISQVISIRKMCRRVKL